jgi:hypothetical protein
VSQYSSFSPEGGRRERRRVGGIRYSQPETSNSQSGPKPLVEACRLVFAQGPRPQVRPTFSQARYSLFSSEPLCRSFRPGSLIWGNNDFWLILAWKALSIKHLQLRLSCKQFIDILYSVFRRRTHAVPTCLNGADHYLHARPLPRVRRRPWCINRAHPRSVSRI